MISEDKDFLKEYINGVSPSGYEMELGGQELWVNAVKSLSPKIMVFIQLR